MSNHKFKLQLDRTEAADILNIGFIEGLSLGNDELVPYVAQLLITLMKNVDMGGNVLKVNGPCSMPIAFVLAAKLKPFYRTVAVFDPKEKKYVVCLTAGGYPLGSLLD